MCSPREYRKFPLPAHDLLVSGPTPSQFGVRRAQDSLIIVAMGLPTSPRAVTAGGSSRHIRSLDGLRGIAAAVVLLHHSLLLFPSLADAYEKPWNVRTGTTAWWLTLTPLHVSWAGIEAVRVFFILSGFVLVLPFLEGRRRPWGRWYPQRLTRLYLPTWGAILFAWVMFFVVPRTTRPGASSWLNSHDISVTGWVVLGPLILVFGKVGSLLTPLWSLQWEVIFSLAFPLYLWFAVKVRRWAVVQVIALTVLAAAGQAANLDGLRYLPLFGVGILFATNRRDLSQLFGRIPQRAAIYVAIGALVLIPAQRYVYTLNLDNAGGMVEKAAQAAAYSLSIFGCVAAVCLASWTPAIREALSIRPIHWIGTRSFSLYLSHEVVVVTVGNLLPSTWHLPAATIAIVVALLIAEVFFRIIEAPSHKIARSIGGQGIRPETHRELVEEQA
jgi:peptidoglycan/LPS O-acetylase OafA/YrhL